ncbi:hypothetical protein [Lewinella sp. JB7]|uniref:hypothetical protein n=1 Tax=Lewinella sp. JB7 TaxID=2962887 RepID=UPI0020C94EFB|nr:hypothetical protein [Lewinella sp. JB7]MCP9235989.1 hypothetical protein [Lewinella sp. JB7]
MKKRASFHIVIDGKACLARELDELCRHFDLLEEEQTKRFRQYLASPFFGHSSRLPILFPIIYQKNQGQACFLQGAALLRKLYKTREPANPERALAKLFRKMQEAVLDFLAVASVQDCRAKRDALLVAVLDGCAYPDLYMRAVADWRESIAELPLGSERLLYSWQMEHAAHFSLSVRKDRQVQSDPGQAERRLDDVCDLYSAQYRNERINRTRIFGSCELPVPDNALYREHRRLIELYQAVEPLIAGREGSDEAYQSFKSRFATLHPRLSRHHALTFYLLVNNYLSRKYLTAPGDVESEWSYWINFMLDNRLYEEYAAITRSFFHNQVQIACIIGDIPLARKLIDLLRHRLTFHHRKTTRLLADTMVEFYADNHEAVINNLSKLGRKNRVHEHLDDEALRFISIRVRSALCLYVNRYEYMDEFNRAMNNFHSLLNNRTHKVSHEKIQSFKRFATIAQKVFTLKNQERLTEEYSKIMGLIATDQPLHAREWLHCLMLHHRPGLLLREREVCPTRHRNAPWLNPR